MYEEEEEEKDVFNMSDDEEMTDLELQDINEYEEDDPDKDH